MKPEELKTILNDHAKWLRGDGGKQADLHNANLIGADLSGADLSGANLRWADLGEANISRTNLSGADICGANLSRTNLSGAKVDAAICRMDFGGWSICVYADRTSIGCRTHSNECWLAWDADSDEIKRMHSDASSWWETHGEVVKAAIRCVMAKTKGGEA